MLLKSPPTPLLKRPTLLLTLLLPLPTLRTLLLTKFRFQRREWGARGNLRALFFGRPAGCKLTRR